MYKSGFVSISGQPNVGKSTLINGFIGEKVAIISDKPETTRDAIRGIFSEKDCQIIFVDTPGIHKPRNLLGKMMLTRAQSTILESDIILFVTEKRHIFNKDDENIRDRLPEAGSGKKVILVINKVDKIKDKKSLLPLIERANDFYPFDQIVPMCALKKKDINKLLDLIKTFLPEGPQLYPEEQLTDKTDRFHIREIIREKILKATHEEVPHSVAVTIESIEEKKDGKLLNVQAVIFVERPSQKAIIIGSGGDMIKRIGKSARSDIEDLLERHVYLDLWVKVLAGWKKDPGALQEMGYSD